MADYYKILEVDRNASPEVIEKAYKTLAKKYHPDNNFVKDKVWANKKMQTINEAYEVLRDPKKKMLYDSPRFSLEVWLNEGLVGLFKRWWNFKV